MGGHLGGNWQPLCRAVGLGLGTRAGGCPSAQLPGRAEAEVTRTAAWLTVSVIPSEPQRVGLCGTKIQESCILVLALTFSGCVSLGKSPDVSGHRFPHVTRKVIG